ncbi:PQQ-binding-like beta-propeller repeat protein [Actinoplanes sp. NPDC051346]|uniref:outer membrane protein assembly factor BamB family protein n=1 Tax=Actinoplanes sp. NPDC051346 TaxID=3155048 RepID=UPI0034308F49
MALIELSPDTPAQPSIGRPPAHVYRRVGLLLATALVLVLGGAVPPTSLIWRQVGVVPFERGIDFRLIDGRVYSVDLDRQPPQLRAWSLDPMRELWNSPGPSGDENRPYRIDRAATNVVVVKNGPAQTYLDARTGAVRWRSPIAVQELDGRTGLIVEERFRPGTEYDPDSGEPGPLYGLGGDVLHTEPALSSTLAGVDLANGRRLWTAEERGSVSAQWAGAPHRAIVVLTAGRLVLRSPTTGEVVREQTVPPVNGRLPEWMDLAGDVALVRYGAFGEGGRVAAYALDTLAPLWQQDHPDPLGGPGNCVGMPCLTNGADLNVLDQRTGAKLWRAGTDDTLFAFGDRSVLETRLMTRPTRTSDRRTGRTQVELTTWETHTVLPDGKAYLLTKQEPNNDTVVGILRAGAGAVQPLGRIAGGAGGCQPDATYVACTVSEGVAIYRYRG